MSTEPKIISPDVLAKPVHEWGWAELQVAGGFFSSLLSTQGEIGTRMVNFISDYLVTRGHILFIDEGGFSLQCPDQCPSRCGDTGPFSTAGFELPPGFDAKKHGCLIYGLLMRMHPDCNPGIYGVDFVEGQLNLYSFDAMPEWAQHLLPRVIPSDDDRT